MSEPQYSRGGYVPFEPPNTARVFVSGNMYADRPEGPWYRILSPAEAKELFEKWKGEQSMTVPDEAVEAAAWVVLTGAANKFEAVTIARAALEAAAPFIAAQAWEEGWDAAYGETGERNPYRSEQ